MKTPPFKWLSDSEFRKFPLQERMLLWAAYAADVMKIREVGGNNRGAIVEEILRTAHRPAGDPWCASFVFWCFKKAGGEGTPPNPASVYGWTQWRRCRETKAPKRGDLFFWLNKDLHGHIGFLVRKVKIGPVTYLESIEGNAQPGPEGNQRDGGGVHRRRRLVSSKIRFLSIMP